MSADRDQPATVFPPVTDGTVAARLLERALAEANTPEHAQQIIRELHRLGETAAPSANEATSAADSIRAAAARIAAGQPPEGGVVDENILRATNPTTAGAGRDDLGPHRHRLRRALVKELKPLQAADTAIFLDINGLPHPPWCNSLMRGLTISMKRADAMAVGLFIAALGEPQRGSRALAEVLPSLWLTTALMEMPVKKFFHRRRPFIDVVRATVVGRRPSSFSFPSGHSAAAFAGATLLRRHYPRWTPAIYLLAVAVGFSRVYLGAHYPSDVAVGGLGGTLLAETSRAVLARPARRLAAFVYPVLRGLRWLMK